MKERLQSAIKGFRRRIKRAIKNFRIRIRCFVIRARNTPVFQIRSRNKLAFLLVLMSVSALVALSVPFIREPSHCSAEEVCIDGNSIFTITGEDRASRINSRLSALVNDRSIRPDSLRITKWDSYITISTDRETLVTFRPEDFEHQGLSSEADRDRLVRGYLNRIEHWVEKVRAKKDLKVSFSLFFLALFLSVVVTFSSQQNSLSTDRRIAPSILVGKIVEGFLLVVIAFFSINLLLLFVEAVFDYLPSNLLIHSNTVLLTTQISEILYVIALIILAGLIYLVIHWLSSKGSGTVILPFEDSSDNHYGKYVSDLLSQKLHAINCIHQKVKHLGKENELELQAANLPPIAPQENVKNYLGEIGAINIKNARFDIGRLLLAVKWLWPLGGIDRVISGKFYRTLLPEMNYSEILIVVRLDYCNQSDIWKASSTVSNLSSIDKLVEEIAYRVSLKLEPDIKAKDWKSFKFFTKALDCFLKYKVTKEENYLIQAERNCNLAVNAYSSYERVADVLYAVGSEYSTIHESEKAMRLFDRAIKVSPRNALAYNGKGNLYIRENKFSLAISEFQKAAQLKNSFSYPHNGMGIAYYLMGNEGYIDKAEEEYLEAIQLEPRYWKPYHNLGNLLAYKKNYDGAIRQFKRALRRKNNAAVPHLGLGWSYLMLGLKEKEIWTKTNFNLKKAQEEYEVASVSHYYSTEWQYQSYLSLGFILLGFKDVKSAESKWVEGIDMIPDQPIYVLTKAIYNLVLCTINPSISDENLADKLRQLELTIDSVSKEENSGWISDHLEDIKIFQKLPHNDYTKRLKDSLQGIEKKLVSIGNKGD